MIRYVIRQMKNPRSGAVKFYPQISPTTPVLRKQVIQRIEKTCTLTSSDIKACLDALEDVIVDLLTQGCTVRLGDLGSFRPTLSAEGTTDPEECNASLIRRVRVKFCPSGTMNLRVAKGAVNFAPYKSLEAQSTGA